MVDWSLNDITAHAYVGINYTINAVTGEIHEKKVVR